ncbi:hypothetical protein Pmani_027057 [Petrolisthes manimaculis]|uniref:Ig-like domain-containing protein n=1 Tax=Petrolisthes manimaculis TaxID=1843537 RepID=A0AAE1P300_9EUCA|nr:hypothetical protein Pmani_027057 [Petrolisthes manimaculis]
MEEKKREGVKSPVVEVVDERGAAVLEKFYKTASTIQLKCTISQMPQAQTFILWRHGDHMLNYDTSRGGISVKTDMSSSVIVSILFIANATPADSGNYTCSLGDVATGSVLVHVLNGSTLPDWSSLTVCLTHLSHQLSTSLCPHQESRVPQCSMGLGRVISAASPWYYSCLPSTLYYTSDDLQGRLIST